VHADAESLADTPVVDERDSVRGWRVVYFLDLGADADQALELAESRIDPHDVENLVRRGCPLREALEILS
jgi:hypothetical protein